MAKHANERGGGSIDWNTLAAEALLDMRSLRATLALVCVAIVIASLAVVSVGGKSVPTASAATPVVDPIPDQIANGGYATTPGLPANTIEVSVSWTDADPGGTHDVVMDWGDFWILLQSFHDLACQ